jgi:hypothetical protein
VSCEWFCVPCLRYLVCNFHQLLQVLLHILCVSALSTPTFSRPFSCTFSKLICGGTVVSTVLQLHFCGHFRVHFCTPTPTSICGCTAMPLFYTYTHLWMYSGLYSAICGQFCIHFHTSTPTFICGRTGDISILHLHSSVDVQRFLQCYSYIFAAIFVYIYVHPHLHSSRPITCLVFKVAKSAWLHFTHQTEISLFSTFSTFYIYA